MPGGASGLAVITCIVGTRAQLIKMAPVLRSLERGDADFSLLFTGQHQVTMAALLQEFGVETRPVYLYQGPEITGTVQMGVWFIRTLVAALRRRRELFPPVSAANRCVVVHGDTFSTLLGALLGMLTRQEVVHVESGLTSERLWEPFPEEITRRIVFRLTHLAFCPGDWAVANMQQRNAVCINTGANTIVDAVREATARTAPASDLIPPHPFAVVSIHRFENVFNAKRFLFIVEALEKIAQSIPLVFVLHPATKKQAIKLGLMSRLEHNDTIKLQDRLTYVPFMSLIGRSRFVVTDGGSNQEELSYLGVPTLLMRGATERAESLDDNVVLSHYDEAVIERFVSDALAHEHLPTTLPAGASPSDLIARHLIERYPPRAAVSTAV